MGEEHVINVMAHPNIYTGKIGRELRIEFAVPDKGVQLTTCLIVFVPGFGGNIDSNIYKKMRKQFADQYDAVTIQCEYFGSSYMQSSNNINLPDPEKIRPLFTPEEWIKVGENPEEFSKLLTSKRVTLPVTATLKESFEEFNDMGYMQAIDILTAIETVKIILNDNQLKYDTNRVIGYGHSHGAYLLHLCNVLSPHTFSFLIDNSAWIEPLYLHSSRVIATQVGQAILLTEFDYLARAFLNNKADLNLIYLYRGRSNHATIISFMGEDDELVNVKEKERFITSLSDSTFILVTTKDVDMLKYKSTEHGLKADFLELFSYSLQFEKARQDVSSDILQLQGELNFSGVTIQSDFTQGLPIFDFQFK